MVLTPLEGVLNVRNPWRKVHREILDVLLIAICHELLVQKLVLELVVQLILFLQLLLVLPFIVPQFFFDFIELHLQILALRVRAPALIPYSRATPPLTPSICSDLQLL